MDYNFTPHTITLYNKYTLDRETHYKRTVIDVCKFTQKDAVVLGDVKVQGVSSGKVVVYEKDLNMDEYVRPIEYKGVGFTFDTTSLVVVGECDKEIESTSDLKGYEVYTVSSALHNDYSFVLPHHFSLEVK